MKDRDSWHGSRDVGMCMRIPSWATQRYLPELATHNKMP